MRSHYHRDSRVDYPQWVRNSERNMEDFAIRSACGLIFGAAAAFATMIWPEYGAASIGILTAWKTTNGLKPQNRKYQKRGN